jgi:hypothetical protein
VAARKQLIDAAQGVLTAFAGPEPVALRGKVAFKDRFDYVTQGPLDDAIFDRWNPQRPLVFTPRLRDPHPFDGVGPVLILPEGLLQGADRVVFVYFDLFNTLVIPSGAAAVGDDFLQRAGQVLGTPDFINQSKPFASFNPRFQGRQHALRPDHRFSPRPTGTNFSALWSRLRH